MLGFGTPLGLGLDSATPAGFMNVSTPAIGGSAMYASVSDAGLTNELRASKLRRIIQTIGKRKGRISEEGIARISRRVGFANDIDAEKLSAEEKARKVGNRVITMAGNTIVIEVDMKDNIPQSLQLEHSSEKQTLKEDGNLASKVLFEDLRVKNGTAAMTKLDRFAENLERLARMDRLSSGRINCFEATSGIHQSWKRLYEKEAQVAKHRLDASSTVKPQALTHEILRKEAAFP